jgi:tight adherence protein B
MTQSWGHIALVVGAGASLIGLAVSGLMISRTQQERDRLRMRMASVIALDMRRPRIDMQAFTKARTRQSRSLIALVGQLFGFSPEKTELYPTRWWIILIITLTLSKIAQTIATDVVGPASIVALPVLWVLMSRQYFGWVEKRRRSQLLLQFPDALAMIVRAIRVGIPVFEAIRIVVREAPSPTKAEFARLVDEVAVGAAIDDAVTALAERNGLAEYRFFATTLALQNQTGGTLSDTLDGLADVIRKRVALKARGKALTSEARASAMVLAALPVITGIMLYVVNPDYMTILFVHPTGKTFLATAVLMLGFGLFAIRTIIQKSLPV